MNRIVCLDPEQCQHCGHGIEPGVACDWQPPFCPFKIGREQEAEAAKGIAERKKPQSRVVPTD
jgi:hypothetical protein